MSAANFAFIAVVNMMLQQRRAAEERARREAKERAWIEQETAEYNRIKESALKKSSEPEKVLATVTFISSPFCFLLQ